MFPDIMEEDSPFTQFETVDKKQHIMLDRRTAKELQMAKQNKQKGTIKLEYL